MECLWNSPVYYILSKPTILLDFSDVPYFLLFIYFISVFSQMPTIFDDKCVTFTSFVHFNSLIFKYLKISKNSQLLRDISRKIISCENSIRFNWLFRGKITQFFANVVNFPFFLGIFEKQTMLRKSVRPTKRSKWSTCRNSIFRKCICSFWMVSKCQRSRYPMSK